MKQDLLKGLTEEQIARVKACKSQEELLSLAKQEGVELTDEQLEAVNGGGCFSTTKCPKCGSDEYNKTQHYGMTGYVDHYVYECKRCGEKWIG